MIRRDKLGVSALLLLIAMVCGISSCRAQSGADLGTLTIDPQTTYQTMTGWEVTARVWEYDKTANKFDPSWVQYRDEMFNVLVDDIGINRIRLEVRSGAENPVDYWAMFEAGEISYRQFRRHFYEKINDNDDPNSVNLDGFQFSHLDYQVENILLPLRDMLEARGEKLLINLCFVDFRWTELKGDFELATAPDEYRELIVLTHQHLLEKYGLTPDYFEIILEPDNTDRWGGYQIGEAIVAVQEGLNQAGFSPELIAPSTAAAHRSIEYMKEIARIPGAIEALSVLAYHRYDGRRADASLRPLRDHAVSHGLRMEMLEYTKGTYRNLLADLSVANASAWQLYMIARKIKQDKPTEAVLIDVDLRDPNDIKIMPSQRARYIAQISRHIRAGATRVGASTSSDGLTALAFENTDGRYVIVLNTDRSGSVEIQGLPEGHYQASYTSPKHTNRSMGVVPSRGDVVVVDIDSPGIFTLVSTADTP